MIADYDKRLFQNPMIIYFMNLHNLFACSRRGVNPLLASLRVTFFTLLIVLSGITIAHGQATFKAVPLDCGGWFSGYDQANDGTLYGFGDVFGAWRSDVVPGQPNQLGYKWEYLNWSIPENAVAGIAIAVQEDDSNVVYYASTKSLFKSVNRGVTWSKLLGDLADRLTEDGRIRGSSPLMIRTNNPNEIWYAGPRTSLTGTLWRSQDGGTSWDKMGGTAFDGNPSTLARTIHNIPQFPNQIWVGSTDGLHVSVDGGNNFTKVGSLALQNVGMIARYPTNVAGATAGTGLVARANSGGGISRITYTDVNNVSTYTVTNSTTFDINFQYPTGLQIFSDGRASAWTTSADRHGVSTAANGGLHFVRTATSVNPITVPIWTDFDTLAARTRPDFGTDMVIECKLNPGRWYMTGGGAPMYSEDSGSSWQYFPNQNGIAAVKTYRGNVSRFNPNVLYFPASDVGGVIVTDGGASGDAQFTPHRSYKTLMGSFTIMEGPNPTNLVYAGLDQGLDKSILLKSNDSGATWTQTDITSSGLDLSRDGILKSVMSLNDANDFLVVLASGTGKDGTITPGTINPGVWRTTNGGASFTKVNGLPHASLQTGHRYDGQPCFIERDAVLPNVRYFASRGLNLKKSNDGGSNWVDATHPFPNPAGGFFWAWSFMADPVRSNELWAAGDFAGIKRSINGGASWTSTAQYINAKWVSSNNGRIAAWGKKAGDSLERIYYSSDNGVTFNPLTDSTRNFFGVQGLTVDNFGNVWVSWNSVTRIKPTLPVIVPAQIALGVQGSPLSYALVTSGDPTSFTLSSGSLPPGVTFNTTTGVLSGTPSATGTFTPSFTASNAFGASPVVSMTITISAPILPVITSSLSSTGTQGLPFLYQIVATNSPASYSASGLPVGLSINTTTGLISGTPSVSGSVNITIGATNLAGTDLEVLSISLTPTFVISGTVTLGGNPLSGVTITDNLGNIAQTGVNGTYSLIRSGGGYTITPSLLSHTFAPVSVSGTLSANLPNQNFVATFVPPTYEGFDYTAGTSVLANKNGGTQWGGSWNSLSNGVSSPGFTYTSGANTLSTTGNRGNFRNNVESFRSLSTSYATGTYWLSFIARSTNPGVNWGGLSLFDNASERFFIGQRTGQSVWGIERGGSGSASSTASTGSSTFIVVKLVLQSGNDSVFFWTNPSLSAIPTDGSAVQLINTADFSFNRIRVSHGLGSGQFLELDEIRLGNSFAEVAPLATPAPVITAGQSASGTQGDAFSYTVTATNSPTSWALISGMPAGLSLNVATGAITGTPSVSGTFTPSFTATNAGGTSATQTVTINLSPSLTLLQIFRSDQGLAANGSQDLETPATDDIENLLKFAFNMIGAGAGQALELDIPNSQMVSPSGNAGLPMSTLDVNGRLATTYIRRKESSNPGVTYVVEYSNTLEVGSWSENASATVSVTSIDGLFERVIQTDDQIIPRRFVRVKVIATP